MTHERWRQIESLYQAAHSLAPEDRALFLSGISDGLRGEVEALLARDQATAASMQTVTQTVAAPIAPGTLLGPYKIEVPLGQGGMGQVFSAIDTRLGSKVAIKISHEHFSDRFGREAKAISSLNHPHICTLYDVGPNYLVMERVDGLIQPCTDLSDLHQAHPHYCLRQPVGDDLEIGVGWITCVMARLSYVAGAAARRRLRNAEQKPQHGPTRGRRARKKQTHAEGRQSLRPTSLEHLCQGW